MSRIGKMPIPVPSGVDVQIDDSNVVVKGPKGTLTQFIPTDMKVKVEDGQILVERPSNIKMHMALHGLTRSLINNMVVGVTEGYKKVLEIHGVGYRAQLVGPNIQLQIGFSHPVDIAPRPGIEFEVGQETNTRMPLIIVKGIDKQVVGQQSAEIRAIKKPEPYKGKGIRYQGEQVRRKAGKSGKAGGK
jgi:large subunit ribosomal protein L6